MEKAYKTYQTDQPCIACGTMGVDRTFHHIKARGSGGSDGGHNMIPLCSNHHNEIHHSTFEMSKKYPSVKCFLLTNGWWLDCANFGTPRWRRNDA